MRDYHLDPGSGECGGVSDTVQSKGNGNKQVRHGSNLNNSKIFICGVYIELIITDNYTWNTL